MVTRTGRGPIPCVNTQWGPKPLIPEMQPGACVAQKITREGRHLMWFPIGFDIRTMVQNPSEPFRQTVTLPPLPFCFFLLNFYLKAVARPLPHARRAEQEPPHLMCSRPPVALPVASSHVAVDQFSAINFLVILVASSWGTIHAAGDPETLNSTFVLHYSAVAKNQPWYWYNSHDQGREGRGRQNSRVDGTSVDSTVPKRPKAFTLVSDVSCPPNSRIPSYRNTDLLFYADAARHLSPGVSGSHGARRLPVALGIREAKRTTMRADYDAASEEESGIGVRRTRSRVLRDAQVGEPRAGGVQCAITWDRVAHDRDSRQHQYVVILNLIAFKSKPAHASQKMEKTEIGRTGSDESVAQVAIALATFKLQTLSSDNENSEEFRRTSRSL
ncbi:hypothetical protein B0H19DRAFT_1065228 [Mycena capillaripes]|nr:hypothetical protein B0H19DRAFT_1065228 [Mycena capillaripes]